MEATAESAKLLLESISSLSRHEFWPDDVSYLDMPTRGIVGYRQVTDAYLVLLARKHGGSIATMDRALAAVHGETTLLAQFASAPRTGMRSSGSHECLNPLESRPDRRLRPPRDPIPGGGKWPRSR